jgi:ketopantoate reductase
MRVCVIGSGVIGTIYGSVFAEAGHELAHYVRPGGAGALREGGVVINLLDARRGELRERHVEYRPAVVERLDDAQADLVLVSEFASPRQPL